MRPLPRSLDPLPEESLPGYLLRLSCRLGLPPGQVLRHAGLTTASPRSYLSAPRGHLVHLNEATAASFAHATRLTVAEVTGLCMISMSDRYPWATPVVTTDQWGPRPVTSPWLFTSASRYCPQCLAGDGSPVQQEYGGAWRKAWRLPVVFACPVHRRLLEHLCPACEQPALSDGNSAGLVPGLRDSGLHPAQCRAGLRTAASSRRASPCGARLDTQQHAGSRSDELDDLLNVQERLLQLLRPGRPEKVLSLGRPATGPQFFADLRLACSLISAAWPAARHLIPAPDLADVLDRHLSSLRGRGHRHRDTPPLDPLPCAALITAAVRLLGSDDQRILAQHLPGSGDSSAGKTPQGRWISSYRAIEHHCSDGFREALRPLTPSFHRTERRLHGRRAPLPSINFKPEHIPEQLQDDWFDLHFRHLGGTSPHLIRRAAAVRLVQMAAGGSLSEAAAFLGVDHRYAKASLSSIFAITATPQATRTRLAEFRIAVHALARQLNDTGNLIDYLHRRITLRAWSIDTSTWQDVTGQLPPTRGPFRPILDDCKREFASQVVWARVTQGEHLLAPHPIQDQQPDPDPAWNERRTNMWSQLHSTPIKPHYADLKTILHAHARTLAATIDLQRSHEPDRASWH